MPKAKQKEKRSSSRGKSPAAVTQPAAKRPARRSRGTRRQSVAGEDARVDLEPVVAPNAPCLPTLPAGTCQPPTSGHHPAPSQPATSGHPPAPSQPTTSCHPPAPSQLANPYPPAGTSQPPHTSQLNPGESLSWPSINLYPQIPPVLHAPSVLPGPPPACASVLPDPPPACAGYPAAAAESRHSETPFLGTANRVDNALQQPPMLGCVCDELGADVAASVKDKIWRGEFVELGVLIRKDAGFGEESQEFCLTSAGSSLLLRPQSKTPAIYSIEQWTSVFLIYSSIYLERHPSRARELLKYMDIVRSITRFGGYNWRSYDVQFRLRQARQPQRSWALIDTELWLTVAAVNAQQSYSRGQPFRAYDRPAYRATLPGKRYEAARGSGQGARGSGQGSLCFAYNKQGTCNRPNCPYGHRCSRCGARSHGSHACKPTIGKRGGAGSSYQKPSSHPN